MQKVFIIGPAHPLRSGGLSTFNQRLAQQFLKEGDDCEIVSFSLQYPSLFFPGRTQYTNDKAPEGLKIHSWINSVNPFNWIIVGKKIAAIKPDIVVVRYWLPFMGPALGTILRVIKKNKHTRIISIADNVIPHEHRPGDRTFTRYFLKSCDAFITLSEKVMKDLRYFEKSKPLEVVQHPLYDTFGEIVSKEEARNFLKLKQDDKIILFFGFIRNYKGLDLLLKAMSNQKIKDLNIKLLVAGEFYEDEKKYKKIIARLGIAKAIILKTQFIEDTEVKYYLCAADCVIQPYRNATQSGVTPLAYHFEKPMIVTNVGGLPSLVPHEKVGLICEPDPDSIASAITRFYQLGQEHFIQHLRTAKEKYSWSNLTKAIKRIAGIIK
ncbi:MAG: glycosyltransferase [Bacteroidota bacterium]|jgi:glycosyltransferase involved in cell wall biosynthesis|nr:glycosyltransferase [Bacteroidota bacterium]